MNNDKFFASSQAVLPSVGRREPERSEGERSATDGKTALIAKRPHPDPEVVAQATRRRFSAEYKQRILAEADQAKGSGGIGSLLRREGLHSSLLATWRRERKAAALQALAPRKRGPKSKRDPVAEENQQLSLQNQRLTEELRKAEIVIDVQKKWPRCWVVRSCLPTHRTSLDGRRHAALFHGRRRVGLRRARSRAGFLLSPAPTARPNPVGCACDPPRVSSRLEFRRTRIGSRRAQLRALPGLRARCHPCDFAR